MNIEKIREEFKFLNKENIDKVGKDIIYFDSAATSQKPNIVIDAISNYYKFSNSNTGRSAHYLGDKATSVLENARKRIAEYINANKDEIVFTKSATESLNLLASSISENLNKGDEIITTILEHHANFVPWIEIANKKNLKVNIVNLEDNMKLNLDELYSYLNENTKVLTITGASNVTGEIIDLKNIINKVRKYNKDIIIIIDATQLIVHSSVDVKELDCDYLVFSGHKIYGPMGIGVLFGKTEKLNSLKPYQYGGNMVDYVYTDKAEYKMAPDKFEAGTLNVAGAEGLRVAIDWLEDKNINDIKKYENELKKYAYNKIKEIENIEIFSLNNEFDTVPIISFQFSDIHPHDITTILDSFGIATRSGHHCAMPLHTYFDIAATTRVSFSIFNTTKEIDYFIEKLLEVRKIMGK